MFCLALHNYGQLSILATVPSPSSCPLKQSMQIGGYQYLQYGADGGVLVPTMHLFIYTSNVIG